MKGLDFLKDVDHERKAAIYAAAHDGKLRNFVYHEEFGECRCRLPGESGAHAACCAEVAGSGLRVRCSKASEIEIRSRIAPSAG